MMNSTNETQINILLVDDRPENLVAMEALLSSDYVNLVKCKSGEEALDFLLYEECALILLDVQMPGIGGYETARLIKSRKKHKDTPIIFVTAINQELEHVFEGYKAGAIDYIFKPFDPDIMISKVENFVDLYNKNRKLLVQTKLLQEKTDALEQANRKLTQLTAELRHMALHDTLTGLPNRTLMQEMIIERTEKSGAATFSLLFLDLDHFKAINDTLGHSYGDTLLKLLAKSIKELFPNEEIVARLGGDEFAILLFDIDKAEDSARKLLHVIQQPIVINGITFAVSGSIGIVHYPEHGQTADILFQRADVAMYHAKRKGNGYSVYNQSIDPNDTYQLGLMGELRSAIDNDELALYYQPLLNMSQKKITGVEALIRWNHPKFGLVPPSDFIPMAERIGFMNPLTYWVLEHAICQCKDWEKQGVELDISVNLSVRDLQDQDLAQFIEGLLLKYKLDSNKLQIEITESFLMTDKMKVLELLSRIKTMGVKIAIDDFGTGYSSFTYIQQLPVTHIKIDRSFVMKMSTESDHAVIVKTLINLAHNLRMSVVAEGVENETVWNTLDSWGCEEAQGYFMSPPLPEDKFVDWLKNQRETGRWK